MPAWDSPGFVFNAIWQALLPVSTEEIPEFCDKVVMVFLGRGRKAELYRRLNPSLEENQVCQEQASNLKFFHLHPPQQGAAQVELLNLGRNHTQSLKLIKVPTNLLSIRSSTAKMVLILKYTCQWFEMC